jgi:Ribulose-5-phosphate 4-epimerase and related epimerases and aldolases
MNEDAARKELQRICSKLYDRSLTVSAGGNMSIRVDDGILITPSGRNKGMLCPSEMVKVTMDGKPAGNGKPSIETGMHLALYRKNNGVNAIVHCHPLYCTALAVKGEKVKSALTPEGILLLGDVPMVRYITPGSSELADAVSECSDSAAILLERHGAVTQGRTLEEAYNRMEELEFQAHLQIIAGGADCLPADEIEKIRCMK